MSKKIGSEHMNAMARQGLRELRAAVYPDSNVAQNPEYGLYGTATPGEVSESRRDDGPDQEPARDDSVVASRVRDARERAEIQPHEPEMEMERD